MNIFDQILSPFPNCLRFVLTHPTPLYPYFPFIWPEGGGDRVEMMVGSSLALLLPASPTSFSLYARGK